MRRLGLSPRGGGAAAVVIFVMIAAALALAGYAMGRADTPRGLQGPPAGATYAVELEPFDDPREVALELITAPSADLASQASGVLTDSSCRDGTAVRSGDTPWSVDNVRRMALHVDAPPFRDLFIGSTGPDVAALQRAIATAVDASEGAASGWEPGRFDYPTLAAYNDLRATRSMPAVTSFARSQIVWLPEPTVEIRQCVAAVGSAIAPGVSLASANPAADAARLTAWPADLVPGRRVVDVGPITARVDQDGREITDPAKVRKIAGFAIPPDTEEGGRAQVTATLALARPIDAATIPASAVVGAIRQCVIDEAGQPVPVEVVDSSLGRAVVTPVVAGALPARVQLAPAVGVSEGSGDQAC